MIADTTQNVSYYGNSPTNWFNGGTTSVGDVVEGGPEFDTNRVNVTTGPLTLQLDFYTQFDGDDLGAHYADIFSWRQEPTRTSSPTASPLARSSAMAASRRAFTRSATII
jgi:hypothetical protein